MILKFCLGCGRWLPIDNFAPHRGDLYPRCGACQKAQWKWMKLRKRAGEGKKPHFRQDRSATTAVCCRCGQRRPMSEFRYRNWICYQCRREEWQRGNERRRRKRNPPKPRAVEVEIPSFTGDALIMAGGICLERTQHQCTVPGARLYVDIWQGTDEAGQLYQGWHWAIYYDIVDGEDTDVTHDQVDAMTDYDLVEWVDCWREGDSEDDDEAQP